MRFILLIIFIFSCIGTFAQDTISDYIKALFVIEDYDGIIKTADSKNPETLTSASLYYAGLAHFMKKNDSAAIIYFDRSISKNPHFAPVYYYKGLSLSFLGGDDEALKHFEAAARLDPKVPDYFIKAAEMHIEKGNVTEAKALLEKALEVNEKDAVIYMLLADAHNRIGAGTEAQDLYYRCLYKADPKSVGFTDCLYNVAFFEMEKGNYYDAEIVLKSLLDLDPSDYHAIEKLMQVYMYDNYEPGVQELRQVMYEAYQKKVLPDDMREQFCFDELTLDGKTVKVCEKFAQPADETFQKHIFYVLKEDGTLDYTVQTEQNSAVKALGKGYYLTKTKDKDHSIYMNTTYDNVIDYQQLKRDVQRVMQNKIEPTRVIKLK